MIRLLPRLIPICTIRNKCYFNHCSVLWPRNSFPALIIKVSYSSVNNRLIESESLSKKSEESTNVNNSTAEKSTDNGDYPFITYSKANAPQVVYDFFKRLVYSQRPVQSRSLLTGALKGVLAGNFFSEFSGYYFEAWWKEFVRHLDNPTTNHPFFLTNINNLGKINKLTNGELSRIYFSSKVYQFLDTKFGQIEFDKLSSESIFLYFHGMSNLVEDQRLFNVKIISNNTIAQTMDFFKSKYQSDKTPNFASAYASFLNCLAKYGCSLNKSDFQLLIRFFKSIFDDSTFASFDRNSSNNNKSVTYDEYAGKCRTLYNFGEAFLQFGVSPDVFSVDILSSWYKCWQRLLTANLKMIEYVRGLSDSERRLSQRLTATEVIKMCDTAAQLNTRFGKQHQFLDSLDLWRSVMDKNVFPASIHTVTPFSNTMHLTALNFKAMSELDSNFRPASLLSDTVAQLMLQKVQNERDYRQKYILMQHEQAVRFGTKTKTISSHSADADGNNENNKSKRL